MRVRRGKPVAGRGPTSSPYREQGGPLWWDAPEKEIEFTTLGAWTIKKERVKAGAEADECWVFGPPREAQRPDLAIEVVWSSGGLEKLEVWRRLGVRELWIWGDDAPHPYVLRGGRYVKALRSEAVPGIDLALLVKFLDRPTTSQAIRAHRAALRKR